MRPGITAITCTGGRPEAFALCERWTSRQTRQPDQWIVVDDCEQETVVRCAQDVIRPQRKWKPGQNTLARNLALALSAVAYETVVFMEDDDYYDQWYLEHIDALLAGKQIAGLVPARYYNLPERKFWRGKSDARHASLCQTAVRADAIPVLRAICERGATKIDMQLWAELSGVPVMANRVVGIKGLPGRAGIGMGHRPRASWPVDADGTVLRDWIGEDAEVYKPFLGNI